MEDSKTFGVFLVCSFLIGRSTKLFGSSSRNHGSDSGQQMSIHTTIEFGVRADVDAPMNSASDSGNDNNESTTTNDEDVEENATVVPNRSANDESEIKHSETMPESQESGSAPADNNTSSEPASRR